jgi:hypothetical protein
VCCRLQWTPPATQLQSPLPIQPPESASEYPICCIALQIFAERVASVAVMISLATRPDIQGKGPALCVREGI